MADVPAPPPSQETYTAIGPMTVLPGADDVEVVLTCTIHAPRERVYAAFTDPETLKQWWGPEGYTVPEATTDPHPSGRYSIVMRAPDGTEYPVRGVFVQAEAPDRIVITDEAIEPPQDWADLMNEYRGEDDRPLRLLVRVLFEETAEGTRVRIINRFPSVSNIDDSVRAQAAEGWQQSLAKLAQTLDAQTSCAVGGRP